MKTKLKISGFVIIVLISTWGWMQNREKPSECFLFNVEALANNEIDEGNCFATGSVDCPRSNDKVYVVLR